MSEPPVARLVAALQDVARPAIVAAPPPRGLPHLGLEHPSGTGFHLLDALSDRGIFRKYELVLDLGAGLGAAARWLAARLGCDVVGTAADVAEARAGAELTRRVRLGAQVRLVPAAAGALPFRTGRFTHVWIIEALPRLGPEGPALAEACRVLRRGGLLAVQDLVRGEREVHVPGWRFATVDARLEALRRTGFVDVAVHDRTSEAAERSPQVLAARARLQRVLAADPVLAPVAGERAALGEAIAGGTLRVVQLLARRP
jgi:SAM-dependent methyltransferase